MIPRYRNAKHAGEVLGFRSGLEEANSKHLEKHGQPVLYETFKIRYAIPLSWHTYTPDFRLVNGILVETKGRWLMEDRAKMLFVKVQYPDLDIRLVFSRGKTPISTGAKTTCAEWAEKHGMKWAEKLIPLEWLREPGPKYSPEEALRRGPVGYQEIFEAQRKVK
ncbi:hypothetical protein M2322_002660 [Rhodoblastus acidophilus]|uniref:hypothetical protein n=1 Tax=Rhodoblastus acidophilus TaxID=1074 RepID=UPI0022241433|nr:hypothetical protein [Rhodoblastus acidophilus]